MVKEPSTIGADRLLALSYVAAARRPALSALWRLDAGLADLAVGAREPMLARIKLAWWRDALTALDVAPPPGEPLLREVARTLLPMGVSGADLARLEEGWVALLADDVTGYAAARGATLFDLSARVLGGDAPAGSGATWALVDLARRLPERASDALTAVPKGAGRCSWPTKLRPLGMLAALAARDVAAGLPPEREGSPGRMARMLRLRVTGR